MCKPSDEDLLAELNGSQVDGLISGFPCPPFSDMGSGHALNEQDKISKNGKRRKNKIKINKRPPAQRCEESTDVRGHSLDLLVCSAVWPPMVCVGECPRHPQEEEEGAAEFWGLASRQARPGVGSHRGEGLAGADHQAFEQGLLSATAPPSRLFPGHQPRHEAYLFTHLLPFLLISFRVTRKSKLSLTYLKLAIFSFKH